MADYGTTVDDVQAHLPHFSIGETSKPSKAHVEGFIATIAGRVGARTGQSITTDLDDVIAAARGVVALGAAAMTEDARYPERTGVASSDYGVLLWERYKEGLDELLEGLGFSPEGGGTGASVTPADPAFAFPAPLFIRNQGY